MHNSATEPRTPSEARGTTSTVRSAARVASNTSLRTAETFEAPWTAAEMFCEISTAMLCEATELAAVVAAASISCRAQEAGPATFASERCSAGLS